MAASITFEVEGNQNVNGSGLGFYGTTWGTSVQIGAYQGSTYITNANGDAQGPAANNVKYVQTGGNDYPMSGIIEAGGGQSGLLCKLNQSESTLVIHFDNDTAVNVQNAQLRIYDRDGSINNPASGVNTKIAELVNFAGSGSYSAWNSNNGPEFTGNPVGSGDCFWWGAPWPDSWLYVTNGSSKPYYENSVGVKFYNYTQTQIDAGSGNPDSRLGVITGDNETVGGSGLIVPLLNNPGSGGRNLIGYSGLLPKFVHYVSSVGQGTNLGMGTTYASGDTAGGYSITNKARAFGGTGTDTRHTWRVALSASPLSIGSKTSYALYVSLEYL